MEFFNYLQIQAAHNRSIHSTIREGRECLSIHLVKDENVTRWGNRPRAELAPVIRNSLFDGGNSGPQFGETWIYEIGVLIPSDLDTTNNDAYVAANPSNTHQPLAIFQWHAGANVVPMSGVNNSQNPIALDFYEQRFRIFAFRNEVNPTNANRVTLAEIYVAREEWTDFRFEVKWSTGADGRLRIFRYDQLIYDWTGPTAFLDDNAPGFKLGLQKNDNDFAVLNASYQRVFYDSKIQISQNVAF